MLAIARTPAIKALRNRYATLRYRAGHTAERWQRAWRYGIGALTESDASLMMCELQEPAGYQILETISVESVLAQAVDRWGELPELPALCAAAVSRVGRKWSCSGDVADAAEEWALELVVEYAAADGVKLPDDPAS